MKPTSDDVPARISMIRIAHQPIGIQQGSRMLFSDYADDGPMWTGEGPREVRHSVCFDEAFNAVPAVMLSISMWDADRGTNLRADLRPERISPEGFDIVFRTWGDSRLARIRAEWIAIGPLRDDEQWELD